MVGRGCGRVGETARSNLLTYASRSALPRPARGQAELQTELPVPYQMKNGSSAGAGRAAREWVGAEVKQMDKHIIKEVMTSIQVG